MFFHKYLPHSYAGLLRVLKRLLNTLFVQTEYRFPLYYIGSLLECKGLPLKKQSNQIHIYMVLHPSSS